MKTSSKKSSNLRNKMQRSTRTLSITNQVEVTREATTRPLKTPCVGPSRTLHHLRQLILFQ